ncbi:MAG: hypothetical protein OEM97_04220, partial [Acidimicrobiia bacterium]|nr:hypothetical protein [Acidimicrobiia bacterium]
VVYTESGERTFLNGVNLGAALPGSWPNDWSAGTRAYTAWVRQIGELGFRSIRTYTLHPAAFYDALAEYNNANPHAPLYLVQGVWFPVDQFEASADLFDPDLTARFDADIRATVAGLTGVLDRRDEPPLGRYHADVTPWLAGVIIGVEWNPQLIAASDATNRGAAPFSGEYVESTEGASPTEIWLAERMDGVASELAKRRTAAPISFLNWALTDPLEHPSAQPGDDLVDIDANHVVATGAWPTGLFATYHAYPYAPDFQWTEPGNADFTVDGQLDPFAAYLTALREHHGDLPVLLAEVGVPGGWVSAGPGNGGRSYGGHLEATQMRINSELIESAHAVGLGGAFLFEWIDEWFKATWNMADLEAPAAGRSAWHNLLSPEQHFGVVAVEPLPAATLDGTVGEWSTRDRIADGIRVRLSVRHDAGSLYLMVQGTMPDEFEIRIDTDPRVSHRADAVDPGSDVAIQVGIDGVHVAERTAYAVPVTPTEGGEHRTVVAGETGTWQPFEVLAAHAGPGADAIVSAVTSLRRSQGDGAGTVPADEAAWARTRTVFEVRIPWVMLGQGDPSTGTTVRIGDGVQFGRQQSFDIRMVTDEILMAGTYAWDGWTEPLFRERLKNGSGALAATLCRTSYG